MPKNTARVFVPSSRKDTHEPARQRVCRLFIVEYEAPVDYEADDLTELKAFAASCYASAAIEGISKAEIDEEYEDLVAEFASSHESVVDDKITAKVAEDD